MNVLRKPIGLVDSRHWSQLLCSVTDLENKKCKILKKTATVYNPKYLFDCKIQRLERKLAWLLLFVFQEHLILLGFHDMDKLLKMLVYPKQIRDGFWTIIK